MRLGATFVNAHNDRSQSDCGGNPFKGKLTNGQLENRINQDIEVHTQIGGRDTVLVGSQLGFCRR